MHALQLPKTALLGIEEARMGNTTKGGLLLEEAMKVTSDPLMQAWYAYCLAREGRNFSRSLQLCVQALRENPENSDIYLALGRIYLVGQRRALAISALEKGLRQEDNPEIRSLLKSIGVRKRPVLPFLQRNNPVNVTSGRLLARWGLR